MHQVFQRFCDELLVSIRDSETEIEGALAKFTSQANYDPMNTKVY